MIIDKKGCTLGLFLLLGLLFGSVLSSQAQGEIGIVEGLVWENNAPAVGATVVIMSYAEASYEEVVITDNQGHFSIAWVPAGAEVEALVHNDTNQVIGHAMSLLNAGETVFLRVDLGPPFLQ